MKQIFKRIFIHGMLTGAILISISSIIALIICVINGSEEFIPTVPAMINVYGSEVKAVVIEYVLLTVFGFVYAAANESFKIDSWSLTRATVVHFTIIFSAYIVIAWFCYFIPHKLSAVFIQAGVFIFNYILIWIGIYFNQLAAVKKINSAISAEK